MSLLTLLRNSAENNSVKQSYDENSGIFTYNPGIASGWTHEASTGAFEADHRYSNITNQTYTVNIPIGSTKVELYSLNTTNMGIVGYSLDGGTEVLYDAYSSTSQPQTLQYSATLDPSVPHTLVARVTGTKNASSSSTYVVADRVDITQITHLALSGSGTLTASGRPTVSRSASFTGSGTLAAGAAIHQFSDNFNSGSLNPLLTDNYGQYSIVNGVLNITATNDGGVNRYPSVGTARGSQSIINSSVFVKVTLPNDTTQYRTVSLLLPGPTLFSDQIAATWYADAQQLWFGVYKGYVATGFGGESNIAALPGSTVWIAIAEGAGANKFGLTGTAGSIYFFTSVDGSTWTHRHTGVTPNWAGQTSFRVEAANDNGTGSITALFDNVNIAPPPAYTGSANFTGSGTLVAAPAYHHFTEDFSNLTTEQFTAKWNPYGYVSLVNNEVVFSVPAGQPNGQMSGSIERINSRFSLVNSSIFLKIKPSENDGSALGDDNHLTTFAVHSPDYSKVLEISYNYDTNSFEFLKTEDDVYTRVTLFGHLSTSPAWLAIAEGTGANKFGITGTAGNTYIFSSLDGQSWDHRHTLTSSTWLNYTGFYVDHTFGGPTNTGTSTAIIDNINVAPPLFYTQSVNLTGSGTLTSTQVVKVNQTRTFTGSGALTPTTPFHQFREPFNDPTLSSFWANNLGTYEVTNGELQITADTFGDTFSRVRTVPMSIRDSFLKIKWRVPYTANSSIRSGIRLINPNDSTDSMSAIWDGTGTITFTYVDNGFTVGTNTLSGVAAGQEIWIGFGQGSGISEFAATTFEHLYIYTSLDGSNWSYRHGASGVGWINSAVLDLYVENNETDAVVASFDYINVPFKATTVSFGGSGKLSATPPAETFTDDFSTDSIATKWPLSYGSVLPVIQDGVAKLTVSHNQYSGLETARSAFTLKDSYIFSKIKLEVPATGSQYAGIYLTASDSYARVLSVVTSGPENLNVNTQGFDVGPVTSNTLIPFNSSAPIWIALAEGTGANRFGITGASGTVYVFSSADGITWTERYATPSPTWITDVGYWFETDFSDDSGTTPSATMLVDNVNIAPEGSGPVEEHIGSAEFSGSGTLTATGTSNITRSVSIAGSGILSVYGFDEANPTIASDVFVRIPVVFGKGTGTVTLDTPYVTQVGDILFYVSNTNDPTHANTAMPSGWTNFVNGGSTAAGYVRVAWKIADESDIGKTWVFESPTISSTYHTVITMFAVGGADTASPIGMNQAASLSATTNTQAAFPAKTAIDDKSLALHGAAWWNASSAISYTGRSVPLHPFGATDATAANTLGAFIGGEIHPNKNTTVPARALLFSASASILLWTAILDPFDAPRETPGTSRRYYDLTQTFIDIDAATTTADLQIALNPMEAAYGIKILGLTNTTTTGTTSWDSPTIDNPKLKPAIKESIDALAVYPPEFIKRSGVTDVLFVSNITSTNAPNGNIGGFATINQLFIDIEDYSTAPGALGLAYIFHHEIQHVFGNIYAAQRKSFETKWVAQNPPGFAYNTDYVNPPFAGQWPPGFVRDYARHSYFEDLAETAGIIFDPRKQDLLAEMIATDSVIAAKVYLMKEWMAERSRMRMSGDAFYAALFEDPIYPGSASFDGSGTLSVTAVASFSDSATFTGSGTLNATLVSTSHSRSVALTGSGTLSTQSSIATSRSVSLTGSGALTSATVSNITRAVALSGSGSFTPTATGVSQTSSASFNGSGALGTQTALSGQATAPLTGSGTLTATGAAKSFTTSVALTGSGTLTSTRVAGAQGTGTLTGSGTLTSAGNPSPVSSASFTGSGTLSSTATSAISQNAGLNGSGSLAGSAVGMSHSRSAEFTGSGALGVQTALSGQTSAALTGSGTLSATGTVQSLSGSASFAGSGSLNSTQTLTVTGSSNLTGSGTLSSATVTRVPVDTAFSGSGTLAPTVNSVAHTGTASLSGSGTLTITVGAVSRTGTASLSGSGSLTPAPGAISVVKSVPLSGEGSLGTFTRPHNISTTNLYGSGTLSPTAGTVATSGAGYFTGSGALTATQTNVQHTANVALTGSGSLTSAPRVGTSGSAGLTGSGTLSTQVALSTVNTTSTSGSGNLDLSGNKVALSGAASLSGSGNLDGSATGMSHAVSAPFTGAGNLTVETTTAGAINSSLDGEGSLDVAVETVGHTQSTELSGSGSVTGTASAITTKGDATLSGSGTLSSITQTHVVSAGEFTGSGTLAATATTVSASASVNFEGESALSPGVDTFEVISPVAFTGSGNLTALATEMSHTADVDLDGEGTLGYQTEFSGAENVSFNGPGNLSPATKAHILYTAGLTGSGTLDSSARISASSDAVFDGDGQLNVNEIPSVSMEVATSGSGELTGTFTLSAGQTVALTSSGELSSTETLSTTGTASFTGSGNLVAEATFVSQSGVIELTGFGTLSPSTETSGSVLATLDGSGELSGEAFAGLTEIAEFTGNGELTAVSGAIFASTEAAFTGTGNLGTVSEQNASGSATFTGSGELETDTTTNVRTNVGLAGSGTLASTTTLHTSRTINRTGSGTLSASAKEVTQSVSVNFSGSGFLGTASASTGSGVFAGFGTGTLTATGEVTSKSVTVEFTGTGSLTATGEITSKYLTAEFNGTGSLNAIGRATFRVSSTFTGSGGLSANAVPAVRSLATFLSSGSLSAITTIHRTETVAFASTGTLAASSVASYLEQVNLTGLGQLYVFTAVNPVIIPGTLDSLTIEMQSRQYNSSITARKYSSRIVSRQYNAVAIRRPYSVVVNRKPYSIKLVERLNQ